MWNPRRLFVPFAKADWWLMSATFILLLFGLSAIYSVALSQGESDFLNVKKQLMAMGMGFVLFFICTRANYRLLRSYSLVLFGIGVLFLLAVLLFGTTVRGTTGWFSLGSFHLQPVEYMKIALPVMLATYFSKASHRRFGLRELLQSGAITAIPVLLTLLQPDLGSALLLLSIWVVVVLFAGMKKKYLAVLIGLGVIVAIIAWFGLLADYQKARLLTFLSPEYDPLGQGYNVTQAMIAVGSGGLTGRGLGFGSQSQLKFIPESQTDFIFAVIAEELGLVGVLLVLGTFAVLLFSIFRHARRTPDDFAAVLLVGLGATLTVQSVVNIGMNLGLMPVTGLGLPLVSYGGSSLIFSLMMLGMVNSIARLSTQASSRMVEWQKD